MTMLAALNRWNVIENGQGITDDVCKGPNGIQAMHLRDAYVNEVEKYKRRFGVKNAYDDDPYEPKRD